MGTTVGLLWVVVSATVEVSASAVVSAWLEDELVVSPILAMLSGVDRAAGVAVWDASVRVTCS